MSRRAPKIIITDLGQRHLVAAVSILQQYAASLRENPIFRLHVVGVTVGDGRQDDQIVLPLFNEAVKHGLQA